MVSQQPTFAPAPAWVENHSYVAKQASSDDAARGVIHRLRAYQFHLPARQYSVQKAYTVTSSDGVQKYSEITVEWDPTYESLSIHRLVLRRGAETIDLAQPARFQVLRREKNLQRFMLDGHLSAVAVLEDVRVGDTVEFSYTVTGENPVFSGHFSRTFQTQFTHPVGFLEYRLVSAPEKKIFTRRHGPENLQHKVAALDALVDQRWTGRDLPEVQPESNVPHWFEEHGSVEVSTFEQWAEVVRWGQALFQVPAELKGELATRVAELKAKPGSEEERIAAAVALVQDEVRYLGVFMGPSTHRPNPPDEAFRRRYGDCKDKSMLLVTILRALGFDAAPALVDSSGGRLLVEKQPAPTVFDHAIARLHFQGRTLWIDGTLSHQGSSLAGRYVPPYDHALVLAEGEKGLTPVQRTADAKNASIVTHRIEQPAWDQPATLLAEFIYEGEQAESVRRYFATTERAAISRRSTESTRRSYEGAEESAPIALEDDRQANRLVVREQYRIPNPWRKEQGNSLHFDLRPSFVRNALNDPTNSGRRAPIAQDWPQVVEHNFSVRLPGDWDPTHLAFKVEHAAFRYERSVRTQGRTWEVKYRWEARADHVPAAAIEEYSKKLAQVRDDLGWTLTQRRSTRVGNPRPSLAAFELSDGAGAWIFAVIIVAAVAAVSKVVSKR